MGCATHSCTVIDHLDHHISAIKFCFGAVNPFLLNGINCITDACCIRQVYRGPNVMDCLMTSRVVPGTSVTIATAFWAKQLSKLLLPALGAPVRTTRAPRPMIAPCRACSITPVNSALRESSDSLTFPSVRKSMSSSGKSIAAST